MVAIETKEVLTHVLIPKHELLTNEEKLDVLKIFNVRDDQLPKIFSTDPAIQHLKAKIGDLIKISRQSLTAGETTYYRIVSDA